MWSPFLLLSYNSTSLVSSHIRNYSTKVYRKCPYCTSSVMNRGVAKNPEKGVLLYYLTQLG